MSAVILSDLHPGTTELTDLVRGELGRPDARAVRDHLRAGCQACRVAIAPALVPWLDGAAAGLLRREPAAALGPLRAACERALLDVFAAAGLAARGPAREGRPAGRAGRGREAREAPEGDGGDAPAGSDDGAAGGSGVAGGRRRPREVAARAAAAAMLGERGLRALVLRRRPLAGDVAVEALLRSSWELRFDDPRRMFDHAEHAGVIAGTLDAGRLGAERVHDLQCRAAAETANAQRILGRHEAAQDALSFAMERFHIGSRDRLLAAGIFEIQARLLGDQDDHGTAAAVLDEALAIYRRHRQPVAMARVLVSHAIYAAEAGEPERAITALRDALLLVGPRRAPTVTLAARQNLGMILTDTGRWREARAQLWQSRQLWPAEGRFSLVGRLHWLQAKVAGAAGDLDGAARAFAASRDCLLRFGDGYGAGLVSLDHAAALEGAGQVESGRALAAAAADELLELDLPREPAVALQLLRTSLRFRATADAIPLARLVRFLHAAQGNPRARLHTYLA